MTTPRPSSGVAPARPSSICQDSAPRQIPCVERPPWTPAIRRQGQTASQLQDSRYVPAIRQSAPTGAGYAVGRASALASSGRVARVTGRTMYAAVSNAWLAGGLIALALVPLVVWRRRLARPVVMVLTVVYSSTALRA